ncbi:MAG: hypothetical protein QW607_05235 [Desulfurococcaceae archaeon]
MKERRALGELMAVLMIVLIVIGTGIALFFMFSGMLKSSGRALLTLTASGVASPDGSEATITLIVQNNGEGTARIRYIYVEPIGNAPKPSDVSVVGATNVTATSGTPPSNPPKMDQYGGLDLASKRTSTISIRITGSNIYPGHHYRISVLYYDIASRDPMLIDTIVTLK